MIIHVMLVTSHGVNWIDTTMMMDMVSAMDVWTQCVNMVAVNIQPVDLMTAVVHIVSIAVVNCIIK